MNDDNPLAALSGETNTESEVDYKSKYEEMQKSLQSERVEAGRLKKANDEIARLRAELEEVNARKRTDRAIESLSEDERNDIPEDYQRGAARIAQATIDQTIAERDERISRLEARFNERENAQNRVNQKEFADRINSAYPGFLENTKPGGDKYEAWRQYQRYNLSSINAAIQSGDYEALNYHISSFYQNFLGISVPSGSGNATPDPRESSGIPQNSYVGSGRTYTVDEYQQVLEKAQNDFQSHLINVDTYTKICRELNNAVQQGRVKSP